MRTTVILTGIAALASAAPAVQTVAASQENGQDGNWHIGCDGKTDANSTNATCTYHGGPGQVPIHARSVISPRSTAVTSASNNKEAGFRISCEADLDDENPEVACSFQYESSSQGAVPTQSRSAIHPRSANAGQPPYTPPPYTPTPPGYTSSVYGKPKYTSTSSEYYPPHSTPSYGSPEYTSAPYGPPTYTSSYSPYTSTSGYEKSAYTSCPPGETLFPHYSFCAPPRTTVNVQSLISSLNNLTRTKRGYTSTSHYVEPHTTSYYKKPTTTSYYEKPHTTSYYKPITTSYYEKPQSIYAPPAVPTLPPTCNFVEEECIDCNESPEECNTCNFMFLCGKKKQCTFHGFRDTMTMCKETGEECSWDEHDHEYDVPEHEYEHPHGEKPELPHGEKPDGEKPTPKPAPYGEKPEYPSHHEPEYEPEYSSPDEPEHPDGGKPEHPHGSNDTEHEEPHGPWGHARVNHTTV